MARVSADQRREDLAAAAVRVMMKVGVPATTTRLISDEAGVPQSVFHYCFRSKEELFEQLTRDVVESMVGEALDAVGNALDAVGNAENFETSVQRSMQGLFTNAAEQPERQLVLYELTCLALRDPEKAGFAEWQYKQYFDHTGQLLVALADRAGVEWVAPINVLSRMVTTMIDGLILGWMADGNTEEATQAMDLFSAQLAGLAVAKSIDKSTTPRNKAG
ncbi:TetR/AcrR family transcriptional regulator [Nocardia tengchongensis]|uniref:TetR/AcrR family transcriptional regulator n=1 Tax=Nocardia tengchongensis TaxID=2055889 RepID=UPI003687ACA0